MRLRQCGPGAVLIELASLDEVSAVRAALIDSDLDLLEVVPAARTVLAAFGRNGSRARLEQVLDGVDLSHQAPHRGHAVTLPVHYDGDDLELVAETAGVSVDEVVARHTGAEYTAAFSGFAPGFGYLTGLPPELQQPRLTDPRTAVPVGAVGIAGEFTGVYPRSSPGGWRLIGRLAEHAPALFDARRDPPALIAPGDTVRFEAVP